MVTAFDVDPLVLERVAVGAWIPDETQLRHGWLLRAADGFTGRGNSALALRHPGDRLDDVLTKVVRWYRDRDLPPRIAVPLPVLDGLAADLDDRGWTMQHGARVLVRDLDGLAPRRDAREVVVASELTEDWLGRYHHRGAVLPDAGRRMLARGDRVALASVRDGDDVVAVGRGVVVEASTGDWLGVNAVETAPNHRRRGLATDVLAALAGWAERHGALHVFLQVDLANDVALAVYRRAGFAEHHVYRYLQAP